MMVFLLWLVVYSHSHHHTLCFDLVTKLNYAVQRSTSITPKILLESEQVVCNEKFRAAARRTAFINYTEIRCARVLGLSCIYKDGKLRNHLG